MTNLNIADEVAGIALAAGLGTRLRPLTLTKPKPLVPFFGVEILSIALNKLKEDWSNPSGCKFPLHVRSSSEVY